MTTPVALIQMLICPYCMTKIEIEGEDNGFGIVHCECDRYPIINNILYLQKDDLLTNKKLVTLIDKKKYLTAVYKSLYTSEKLLRVILFLVYAVYKKWSFLLGRDTLLHILKLFSVRSKPWFDYLLKRKQRSNFEFSKNIVTSIATSDTCVLDIGCGIGHLHEMIYSKGLKARTYIGIDKNFSSLLIARLYVHDIRSLFICTDIEIAIPLKNNIIDHCYFLDCFTWIFAKQKAISESFRTLKTQGSLYLINLFAESAQTSQWGYGIDPMELNKKIKKHFLQRAFYSNAKPQKVNKVDSLDFSCIAKK